MAIFEHSSFSAIMLYLFRPLLPPLCNRWFFCPFWARFYKLGGQVNSSFWEGTRENRVGCPKIYLGRWYIIIGIFLETVAMIFFGSALATTLLGALNSTLDGWDIFNKIVFGTMEVTVLSEGYSKHPRPLVSVFVSRNWSQMTSFIRQTAGCHFLF